VIKSPLDIQINRNYETGQWEHSYPDEILRVRDPNNQLFTLIIPYLFFTEDENVTMEVRPCFYHLSMFTNKVAVIGGDVNISSYARPSELAFILKPSWDELSISFNDPLFYINFITKKNKVKLKRFDCVDSIRRIAEQTIQIKNSRSTTVWPMEKYYSIFNESGHRGKLLKLIKENLLD